MAIHILVDPGEVYVIGEFDPGTSTPTGRYKIGMTQNDRTTYDRIIEHQTGNPNRLFIHGFVACEASYLVEKLMHNKWNANRIGQEWFTLTAAELAQVMNDIVAFEAQHGPRIVQVRPVYYVQPNNGDHPGLTPSQIAQAHNWRDQAYALTKEMVELKYEYETIRLKLLTMNGVNSVVDSVSKVNITPPYTEFSESLLPAAVKAQYKTLAQKRKNDFRFRFTQTSSKICDQKLGHTHWKSVHGGIHTIWEAEKGNWEAVEPTITISSVNSSVQARTAIHEALHQDYVEKLRLYDEKKTERQIIELELRILCFDYEGIADVCQWKRAEQNPKFNKPQFKVLEPTMFNDPAYQAPRGDTARPSIIKFKAW